MDTNAIDASVTKNWTILLILQMPLTLILVWFEQSILHNYHGNNVDAKISEFLNTVGRRWHVTTLFTAFKKADRLDEAAAIYKTARPNYHSVTANIIDDLLGHKE